MKSTKAGAGRIVATAWTVGATATVVVMAAPGIRFAYRSYTVHVVLETAEALIAVLLAYLLYGRFCLDGRRHHLVLASTLTMLASIEVAFVALPAAVTAGSAQAFTGWAVLAARFCGAVGLLVAAAGAPGTVSRRRRLSRVWVVVPAWAVLAVIGGVMAAIEPSLPSDLVHGLAPEASGSVDIGGNLGVASVQAATGLLMFLAAAAFARRAAYDDDELMTWFAGAAVLGGFARVMYALFPSMSTQWVYSGDLLRLGFYLLLLLGAAREIGNYWERSARVAAVEERRRVARDLHDGLAQELAFIATLARRMKLSPGSTELASAAQRALDESRRAIAALRATDDEPLDHAVSQAAEEVAARCGTVVRLALTDGVHADAATREALVRVVREAVGNASRHGGGGEIRVTLSDAQGIALRVEDDGCGFDVDEARLHSGHFGLLAMQERAAAVGGRLQVTSVPGKGTAVEVRLP